MPFTNLMHGQKRSLCLQWLVSPLNWYLFAVLSAVGEFTIKKRLRRILICKTRSKSQSIRSAPGLKVFSSSNIVADTLMLLGTFYRHPVSRNILLTTGFHQSTNRVLELVMAVDALRLGSILQVAVILCALLDILSRFRLRSQPPMNSAPPCPHSYGRGLC